MMKNSSYRNDLTSEQKMDILVDAVIDALHKVVERYRGTDKVADIRAALDNLIAHKQDVNALRKGMSYCTDNWIFGSVNCLNHAPLNVTLSHTTMLPSIAVQRATCSKTASG